MTWIAGGALVLVLLLFLARGFANAPVGQVKKGLAWVAGGLGVVLLAVLLLSGRGPQAIWVLFFFGPLLVQLWRSWRAGRRFSRGGQASPGQQSRVATAMLEMVLDHDSGVMEGRVLRGAFEGRRLADLSPEELRALLDECAREDEQSVPLLEAWLDRDHPGWREEAAPPPAAEGPMTRGEALAILGLQEGAGEATIRAAHRRLMRSAHPDRGGSEWLAARLNAARDHLLRRG